jgi:hypothetical protein
VSPWLRNNRANRKPVGKYHPIAYKSRNKKPGFADTLGKRGKRKHDCPTASLPGAFFAIPQLPANCPYRCADWIPISLKTEN